MSSRTPSSPAISRNGPTHYRASKSKLDFTIVNDGSTDDTNKLGAIGDINLVITSERSRTI